jgi:DNA-binding GntR family transcriptional regulator
MIEPPPRTKEEQAYERLKNLILAGQLPRNQFLSQRMLAEKAGTNITTIRTALRQLESDDLVQNVPRWGVRIPRETEEVVRDRYFVRELLEVGAVRRIIARRGSGTIDTATISEKARLVDEIARELPKDIDKFSRAHFDFHVELARQSGSPLLLLSLSRIHFKSIMLGNARRAWARGAPVNHEDMVQLILESDEPSAVEAMVSHIQKGLEGELQTLREELAETPAT